MKVLEIGAIGSNCTFMELKLGKSKKEVIEISVLIVPLWN